jgi:hypothetical protein
MMPGDSVLLKSAEEVRRMVDAIRKSGHKYAMDEEGRAKRIWKCEKLPVTEVSDTPTFLGLVTDAVEKAKQHGWTSGRLGWSFTQEDISAAMPEAYKHMNSNRIGRTLKAMGGWERKQITHADGHRAWIYFQRDS